MSLNRPTVVHVNASPTLGGAEVYTAFLARALQEAGWDNRIVCAKGAAFWNKIVPTGVHLLEHDFRLRGILTGVPEHGLLCIHAPAPKGIVDGLIARHRVLGIGHQAVYSTAIPYYYQAAHSLLPVSIHVADTLRKAGFTTVHDEPLLGVAALNRGTTTATVRVGPLVEWDRRKLRDRLLSAVEPLRQRLGSARPYLRRPGLTLGIVSRLAPLKQFPDLFRAILPVLRDSPDVNLELFGSAIGYRSLRELRTVLRPLGQRARFWGFQSDVSAVYAQLDYLLTGLPEREALGLNVIEAQQCGVPVLAVDAPPFVETMIDGATGYLYCDPRRDGGAGFAHALQQARDKRPDPRLAIAHLARFSFESFRERADRIFSEEAAHMGRQA